MFLCAICVRILGFFVKLPCRLVDGLVKLINCAYTWKFCLLAIVILLVPSLVWSRYHHVAITEAQKFYSCTIWPLARDAILPLWEAVTHLYEMLVPYWNFYWMIQRKFLWDVMLHAVRCKHTLPFVTQAFNLVAPVAQAIGLLARIAANTIAGISDPAMPNIVKLIMDALGDLSATFSCIVDCYCSVLRILTDALALTLRNPHLQCSLANFFRFFQELFTVGFRFMYVLIDWLAELLGWLGQVISGGGFEGFPAIESDKLPNVDRALDVMIAYFCCTGDFVDDVINSILHYVWDLIEEITDDDLGDMPVDVKIGGIYRGLAPPVAETVRISWYVITARFGEINETLIMDSLEYMAIEVGDAVATFTWKLGTTVKYALLATVRFVRILLTIAIHVRNYQHYKEVDWNCMFNAWKQSTTEAADLVDAFMDEIPKLTNFTETMYNGEVGQFIRASGAVPIEFVHVAVEISKNGDDFDAFREVETDCLFDVMRNFTNATGELLVGTKDNMPIEYMVPPLLLLKLLDPEYELPIQECADVSVATADLIIETLRLIMRSVQHGQFGNWQFERGDTDLYREAWRTWAVKLGKLTDHVEDIAGVVGLEETFGEFGPLGESTGLVISEAVGLVAMAILHPNDTKDFMLQDVLCALNNAALDLENALQILNQELPVPYWGNLTVNFATVWRSQIIVVVKMLDVLNTLAIEAIDAIEAEDGGEFDAFAVRDKTHEFLAAVNTAIDEMLQITGSVDESFPRGGLHTGHVLTSAMRTLIDLVVDLSQDQEEYQTILQESVCAIESLTLAVGEFSRVPVNLLGKVATLIAAGIGPDEAEEIEEAFAKLSLAFGKGTLTFTNIAVQVVYLFTEMIPVFAGDKEYSEINWGDHSIDTGLLCLIDEIPLKMGELVQALDLTGENTFCELGTLTQNVMSVIMGPVNVVVHLIAFQEVPLFNLFARIRPLLQSIGNLVAAAIHYMCDIVSTGCTGFADKIGHLVTALLNVFTAALEAILRTLVRTFIDVFSVDPGKFDLPNPDGDYYDDFAFFMTQVQILLRAIGSLLNDVADGLGEVFNLLADVIGLVFINETSPVARLFRAVSQIVITLLKLLISLVAGGTGDAATEFFDAIWHFFTLILDIIVDLLITLIDRILFGGAGVLECLLDIWDCIWDTIFKRGIAEMDKVAIGQRLLQDAVNYPPGSKCRETFGRVGAEITAANGNYTFRLADKVTVVFCLKDTLYSPLVRSGKAAKDEEECGRVCMMERMGAAFSEGGIVSVELAKGAVAGKHAVNLTALQHTLELYADPLEAAYFVDIASTALNDSSDAWASLVNRSLAAVGANMTTDETASGFAEFGNIMKRLAESWDTSADALSGLLGRVSADKTKRKSVVRTYPSREARDALMPSQTKQPRWLGEEPPECGHDNNICVDSEECYFIDSPCDGGSEWEDCFERVATVPRPCPATTGTGISPWECTRLCRSAYHQQALHDYCYFNPSLNGWRWKTAHSAQLSSVGWGTLDCHFFMAYGNILPSRRTSKFCGNCELGNPSALINTLTGDNLAVLDRLCDAACSRYDPLCRQTSEVQCHSDRISLAVCDRYCLYNRDPFMPYLPPAQCTPHINKYCAREFDSGDNPITDPAQQTTSCASPVPNCDYGSYSSICNDYYDDAYFTRWPTTNLGDDEVDEFADMNVLPFFCPNTGRDETNGYYTSEKFNAYPQYTFFNFPQYWSVSTYEVEGDWCDYLCGISDPNCEHLFDTALECSYWRYQSGNETTGAKREFCKLFPPGVTITSDSFPLRSPGLTSPTNEQVEPMLGLSAHACPMPDGRWGNQKLVHKYSCYMLAPGEALYTVRSMNNSQKNRIKAAQPHFNDVANMWDGFFTRRNEIPGNFSDFDYLDDDVYLDDEQEPDTEEEHRYEQMRGELARLVERHETRNGDGVHDPLQPVCHPGRLELGDPGVECDDHREGYEPDYCTLQSLDPAYPDYETCGEYPCESPAISPCVRVAGYTEMPEDPYDVPEPEEPEGPELRTVVRGLMERRWSRDVSEQTAFSLIGRTARRRMLFDMCRVYPWLDHCAEMYSSLTHGGSLECARPQRRRDVRNDWPHGPYPYNCNASFADLPFNTSLLPPVSAFRWDCYFLCGHNYTDLIDRACLWDAVPRNGSIANVTDFLLDLLPEICEFVQMSNGSEFLYNANASALSFFADAEIDFMDPGDEEHEFGGSSHIMRGVKRLFLRIINWIVSWFVDGVEFKSLSGEDIGDAICIWLFKKDSRELMRTVVDFAKNTNTDRRYGQEVGLLYWLLYPVTSDCYKLNCADDIWGIPIWSPAWLPAVPRCIPRFVYEKILLKIFHGGYLLHEALVRIPDEGCLDHDMFAIPYSYFCECDDVKMRHCGRALGFWGGWDNIVFAISYYWPGVHNSTTVRILAELTFTEYWLDKFEYYHYSDIQTAYHQCFWITIPNVVIITVLPALVIMIGFLLCGGVLTDISDAFFGIVVTLLTWIGARAEALKAVLDEQMQTLAQRATEMAQTAAEQEQDQEYVGAQIDGAPVETAPRTVRSNTHQWQRRLRRVFLGFQQWIYGARRTPPHHPHSR